MFFIFGKEKVRNKKSPTKRRAEKSSAYSLIVKSLTKCISANVETIL